MEEVIELDSDMRLQDAQGLPAFLLTPGTGKGVHRPVPVVVNDVSNASLFRFRIKSPRLRGRLLTTPITLSSPPHAGEWWLPSLQRFESKAPSREVFYLF